MRAFYSGVIFMCASSLASSLAHAGKPRGKLECTTTFGDGSKAKVPSKHLRLDQPVQCRLTASASDPTFVAQVQTRWTDYDDKGKKQKKVGQEHSGGVAADKPVEVTLVEEKDFVGCVDFTIDARIVDDKGKASWKKSVKVKQFCPD
jgi:hypothetical protein